MKRLLQISLALVILLVSAGMVTAQSQENRNLEIWDRLSSELSDSSTLPMNELVIKIGLFFLNTPYVAGTLESEPEALHIYLDKTDCILYVEMCYAAALALKGISLHNGEPSTREEPSYSLLQDNIRNMRYREGIVNGYSSRLHYTSDWLQQSERNGIIKEYTDELGIERTQKFNFMSTHPDSYKQLKGNKDNVKAIQEYEKVLEAHAPYFYIPQSKLKDPLTQAKIKDGDIICFVTDVAGLDISHTAIAYRKNGVLHFLHASSAKGKVVIEEKSLADYAKKGIRVARPSVQD